MQLIEKYAPFSPSYTILLKTWTIRVRDDITLAVVLNNVKYQESEKTKTSRRPKRLKLTEV